MRKISLVLIIFLIISISIILIYPKKENEILNSIKDTKNSMLSIMVEREAGTGKYIDASSFPNAGYYLNKNLSKCLNGSKISFNEGNLYVKGNKTDRCYAYFDKDELGSICRGQNLSECFTKNYKKDSSIIYHDGAADYEEEENYKLEAEDLSYRFTGTNDIVNNYVCFNSNADDCLEDNLYRIIGFFKNENGAYEAKLIKATEATTTHLGTEGAYCGALNNSNNRFCWNNSNGEASTSLWAESNLNNINLNGYYLNNYLNSTWQTYINNHKWITAYSNNINSLRTLNARELYNIDNNKENATFEAKLGLMYLSDYFYAAENKYWNSCGNDNTNHLCNVDSNITFKDINWLYPQNWELVIYPFTGVSYVFGGYIIYDKTSYIYTVRPTFYLTSTIKLKSGNGTKENPYRIEL